jgi:hypothetical protein
MPSRRGLEEPSEKDLLVLGYRAAATAPVPTSTSNVTMSDAVGMIERLTSNRGRKDEGSGSSRREARSWRFGQSSGITAAEGADRPSARLSEHLDELAAAGACPPARVGFEGRSGS